MTTVVAEAGIGRRGDKRQSGGKRADEQQTDHERRLLVAETGGP
jgi:hypothetical protein